MQTRRRFLLTAGAAAAAFAATAQWRASAAQPRDAFEVTHPDAEWRRLLTPAQYDVLRHEGTERALYQPAQRRASRGDVLLRRLPARPLFVAHEVRQPYRLAELLGAARSRGRDAHRQFLRHGAQRSALQALRRASRPRLRRRPEAHRPALLHERRRDEVHAGRGLSAGSTPTETRPCYSSSLLTSAARSRS